MENWLYLINNQLDIVGVPDALRIKVVAGYCKGYALETLKAYEAKDDASWTGLQAVFKEVFKPIGYQKSLRSSLVTIKQKTTVSEFSKEFLSVSSKIDDLSQRESVFHFIRGLKLVNKEKLALVEINTLTEAINNASKLEQNLPV